MPITSESSAPYQNVLDRTVPSPWAGQLRNDLDELQAHRAAKVEPQICGSTKAQPAPDKLQAMKARALHAGADKIMYLEAAVEYLLRAHRPQLVSWTGSRHSRAEWAKKQLQAAIGYAPGWRTIDNHLKTLSL